jgi:hypothetical protein
MMLKTLALGIVLLASGVGLGAALWLAGPAEGGGAEDTEWTAPAYPRPAANSTREVVEKLAGFPVFGIAAPPVDTESGPAEAEAPARFPKILSIAVLNGKARAFFLSDDGARISVGVGDEIVGWLVKAISMKGVMVEKDSSETLLRPFEQIEIPTAPAGPGE